MEASEVPGDTMTTGFPEKYNLDEAEGIGGEKITETFGMGLLNGTELIQHAREKVKPLSRGQKLNHPRNTFEEQESVTNQREHLHKLLLRQRVEKKGKRAVAVYDEVSGWVEVTELLGKLSSWGYTLNKKKWLHSYEALYLLEMNNVEIYYQSTIVSLEQAYVLFLQQSDSLSYDLYYVYSYLGRLGLSVYRYEGTIDESTLLKIKNTKASLTHSECKKTDELAWDCLNELLGLKSNVELQENSLYKKVKASMLASSNIIREAKSLHLDVTPSESTKNLYSSKIISRQSKRKNVNDYMEEPSTSSKKIKIDRELAQANCQNNQNNLNLDILKNEGNYAKYKEIFDHINLIECGNDELSINQEELHLDFDLYHSPKTKKNPRLPDFRVIVRTSDQQFPKRGAIASLLKKTCHSKIPIILIIVSETMSLQTFLYKL